MFILLCIILFIIIITYIPYDGGNDITYIHVVPRDKSNITDTLLLGLANLYKLNISHKERRVLNAYIFSKNAEKIIREFAYKPVLTDIDHQRDYYSEYVGVGYEEFKIKILTEGNWGILTNNDPSGSIDSYKKLKLMNRRKHGYKPPVKEDYNTRLIYTIIDIVFKGDQWSVIDDMDKFIKQGYMIECFGSAINTRLKYFGSMLKNDKKYGALGTCQEILKTLINKKTLKYNNTVIYRVSDIPKIMISPPSGYDLQNDILNMVTKLLELRPIEIHMGMSGSIYKNMQDDFKMYMKDYTHCLNMYEMVDNEIIFRKKLEEIRGWYNCTFNNIEHFNFKKFLQKNTVVLTKPDNSICGVYFTNNTVGINKYSYIFTGQKYIYPTVEKYTGVLEGPTDLPHNPYNPPLKIIKIDGYTIIDDSVLPGGTKQRGLFWFMDPNKDPIYAGPSSGVAQVAMGIISKHYGRKAYMYSSGPDTMLTARAKSYGVKIIKCGDLENCQKAATNFNNKNTVLLPFGLNDPVFIYYLAHAINMVKGNINPKRLWLVCGSGVLLHTLYYVFPTTYFLGVQVGKTIWPDEIDPCRTRIFIHPQGFIEDANDMPPYNAISNYDAKLWYFIKLYGEPGDYIWNVAG